MRTVQRRGRRLRHQLHLSPENKFEIYQTIGPDMTATAVDEYTVDV
jgi:hypothetical protein